MNLDPTLNIIPSAVRHIHLMGICGTGMASLAGLLKETGATITGSDHAAYPPMSNFLERMGIEISLGYSEQNLFPRPDLVVVGNVITRANEEAKGLAKLAIPYASFPQALFHFFLRNKTPLVITGTHGKTTTSSILAHLLHLAGLDPGFMIGGVVQGFGRNSHLGRGQYFVVEGDEYDTAFFDKSPKFLHYLPEIAIITNVEFDHADIYQDFSAVKSAFRRLISSMPNHGLLVACLDDPAVKEVISEAPCRVMGYGLDPHQHWSLSDIEVTKKGTSFTVSQKGKFWGRLINRIPGRHNALNALAAIAVADRLGLTKETIQEGLATFQGIKRRQEVRGTVRGIIVIDDFAHHPTAVRVTLEALRGAYPGSRLVAVFEPRTNSSRRNVFQEAYVTSFDNAQMVIVKEPPDLAKIPEGERFSSLKLVADLTQRGVKALYFSTTDEIIDFLGQGANPGDVIPILSNGGFDNIHERLLTRLQT